MRYYMVKTANGGVICIKMAGSEDLLCSLWGISGRPPISEVHEIPEWMKGLVDVEFETWE